MKKSYTVFVDGQHEYTIKSKTKKNGDIKHTIYHSEGEQWSENIRGKKILTIIEGDLEMEIKGMDGVQPYDKVYELKLLLSFITRDYNDGKFEIVENEIIHKG